MSIKEKFLYGAPWWFGPLIFMIIALPFISLVWMFYTIYKLNKTADNLRNLTLALLGAGIICAYFLKVINDCENKIDLQFIYIVTSIIFIGLIFYQKSFTMYNIIFAFIAAYIFKLLKNSCSFNF